MRKSTAFLPFRHNKLCQQGDNDATDAVGPVVPKLFDCKARHTEPIRFVGQPWWPNRATVSCSIQFEQQHSMQSARAFEHGVPKVC